MLESIVRKVFNLIGLEELSDQDVIRFIRFSKLDNLIYSPITSGFTKEAKDRLANKALENILCFLKD